VVIDVAQGVRACGGFISVGPVNLLASPSLKHQRFVTRARAWLFAELERLRITATRKNLDDEDAALAPPDCIGKLLLAEEAQRLSDRICAAKADRALQLVEHGD
jgi:hypothetical protein